VTSIPHSARHRRTSYPMANVVTTPCGSSRPPPHEINQQNNDRQLKTTEAKGQKKRGAINDGNTPKKSHKRSSAEGNDDDDKAKGGANGAPGDGDRSTAHNGREASGTQGAEESKDNVDSATTQPAGNPETNENKAIKEAKGQKKRGANDDGKTAKKSHIRSSTEGDNDEEKEVGANGAPGGRKRLLAHNGRKALGTPQGAGSKNEVNRATMPPDGDAETNEQRVDLSMQTPVQNNSVSKNGFFQSGKTQKSNLTIIRHTFLLQTRNPYLHGRGYYQPSEVARNSSKRTA
jgi:hypothetical protein